MGKKAYNSADRALVWKTSGGKTKYLLGDADALVHDAPEAVRDALTKLIGKSKPVNLGSVKARQKELQNRLKRFGATDDPNVVWKAWACATSKPPRWPLAPSSPLSPSVGSRP